MAAVRFTTTAESENSMTLTFSLNPSFPQPCTSAEDADIPYRMSDGTPYREVLGKASEVPLTWPPEGPLSAADFGNLQTFWRYVRGTQDAFLFRDHEGVEHSAKFLEGPVAWAHEPHGFAGQLVLLVTT